MSSGTDTPPPEFEDVFISFGGDAGSSLADDGYAPDDADLVNTSQGKEVWGFDSELESALQVLLCCMHADGYAVVVKVMMDDY